MNEILLRRKLKVIVITRNEGMNPENYNTTQCISTILKNIECLAFTFSKRLIQFLCNLSFSDLRSFYLELIPILKELSGSNVVYKPMYPNFPTSVMDKDSAELYMNAFLHYVSNGTLLPNEEKDERLPLFDETKVKIIDLGTKDDLIEIFNNLVTSKTSISSTDKEDMEWIFKNMAVVLPDEIPLKENAALIGKLCLEYSQNIEAKDIQKYFKTATDVLRLVTAMSYGDISLATNTKFRNFNRKERKMIMKLLNGCNNILEDMNKYKNRWIRVGEKLHPSEFKGCLDYANVTHAFDCLRNGIKIETFNSEVTKAIETKDFESALNLLKKRPGELARRLDHLLRTVDNKNIIINTFKNVAIDVSNPVLLQVREHFMSRDNDLRVFFPKGNLAKSYGIHNTLPEIGLKYCAAIVKICENALIEHFKGKDFLGNVYLSEEFKNYIVPFSQRSASKTVKAVVRGSKFSIPENTNVLRAFIWWTNTATERVDVDLTAAIFDEKWNYREHISYTNLNSMEYNSCHSGDITNGGPVDGDGVAEFIDIDIDSVVKNGARYVVYQVYNYTGSQYSDMEHAMFGWMNRESMTSGEIFEPKTLEQKMDLTSQSSCAIPVIFDCVNREVIWCDMCLSINRLGSSQINIESNINGVLATCYSMVNISKPNLYDLIDLHIKARGISTSNKEDADIIFDIDDGITPFDIDVFMSEYL